VDESRTMILELKGNGKIKLKYCDLKINRAFKREEEANQNFK